MKTSRIILFNQSNENKMQKLITNIPTPKYLLHNIYRQDDFQVNSFSHDKNRNDIGISVNNFATQNSIFKDLEELNYIE